MTILLLDEYGEMCGKLCIDLKNSVIGYDVLKILLEYKNKFNIFYEGELIVENIDNVLKQLQYMNKYLKGEVFLKEEYDDDNYLKLSIDKLGKIFIEFNDTDSYNGCSVHIKAGNDQTVLGEFINFLMQIKDKKCT